MATLKSDEPINLWTHQLQISSRSKEPVGNIANVMSALELAPELTGMIGLNSFDQCVWQVNKAPWNKTFEKRQWGDVDDTELQVWIQTQGVAVSSGDTIHRAVNAVANRHQFHPLRDYFDAIKWDGTKRIDFWLNDYLGAAKSEYTTSIGRKFLIGATARIYDPGCKMDTMLVLEGPQGIRKSQAIMALGQPWSSETLPEVGTKDAMQHLLGAWFIEMAELSAIRHKEVETVKSFIARCVDRFRLPYGRRPEDFPRQCVFIASTNEGEYLLDTTGNRRFWPVLVTDIDIEALTAARDQLIAEALHCYRAGETWYFTEDDEVRRASVEQELRRVRHPWEDVILPFLDQLEESTTGIPSVTMPKLFEKLDIPISQQKAWDSRRIGEIVRAHGWLSSRQGRQNIRTFTKPKMRHHATP